HVSNLKKCLADASLHVALDKIKVDKTLRFVEEPVEIMDREIKSLKRSKNSKCGPEFTWEREDYMKSKYPQLFVDRADESASVVLCDFMCTKWFTYVHDVILENKRLDLDAFLLDDSGTLKRGREDYAITNCRLSTLFIVRVKRLASLESKRFRAKRFASSRKRSLFSLLTTLKVVKGEGAIEAENLVARCPKG
ncbi:hypothetical protein Tco_0865148, partial [Tanacetum coccineum]